MRSFINTAGINIAARGFVFDSFKSHHPPCRCETILLIADIHHGGVNLLTDPLSCRQPPYWCETIASPNCRNPTYWYEIIESLNCRNPPGRYGTINSYCHLMYKLCNQKFKSAVGYILFIGSFDFLQDFGHEEHWIFLMAGFLTESPHWVSVVGVLNIAKQLMKLNQFDTNWTLNAFFFSNLGSDTELYRLWFRLETKEAKYLKLDLAKPKRSTITINLA